MKLRRLLYLGGAFVLVLIKFTIDVIGKNVELDIGGLSIVRELAVVGAFVLVYLVIAGTVLRRDQSPVKSLGFLLIALGVMLALSAALGSTSIAGFDAKNLSLLPLDYPTLFVASLLSLAFGLYSLVIIRLLRDLVLFNRSRGTRRNFLIFIILVLLTALSALMMKPLDSSLLTTFLFVLTLILALVNSFRLSWIVYLTKREKVFALVYAFFLFAGVTLLNVLIAQSSVINRSLIYYSRPLKEFVTLAAIFGNIYFGMAFVSTLFHLPTAEAFDRKRSEVSSLHNLSKLITQVFDFNELVDTVTSMTLQVCEAKSCWLEILHAAEEMSEESISGQEALLAQGKGSSYHVQVVGMKNITLEEINTLLSTHQLELRSTVMKERRPMVVDDLSADPRFQHVKKAKLHIGSIVAVPLVSHAGLMGILYATKKAEYGFSKDDVDVISAFADQATIAVENSRLIKRSIERERLLREMLVAQEMQRKLLPQSVPQFPTLEIDAISTPAFEVGGDYYDFMQLNPTTIGIAVGDVSGKGVSAAFYMSEVKGIFQALSRMYSSPKQFMIKANEALAGSIDKRSFVSLIYAIVDVTTGSLILSRAGHCPMLHVSGDRVRFIRPDGMGMGLTEGVTFEGAIEEVSIQLREGDVCVFYTDGVTEARRGEDEFGYERLLEVAQRSKRRSASDIKQEILDTVKKFTNYQANDDDLTLVVLKWRGQA